jgi:hypothetical protein
MTGKQVLASGVAIVFATAILPPAAAWLVNRQRVQRAEREVAALADRLAARPLELARARGTALVLSGSGRVPAAENGDVRMWVTAPRAALTIVLSGADPPPDPWGNAYLAALADRARQEPAVRVLSAGPNGVIDTPFDGSPQGDDLATSVR